MRHLLPASPRSLLGGGASQGSPRTRCKSKLLKAENFSKNKERSRAVAGPLWRICPRRRAAGEEWECWWDRSADPGSSVQSSYGTTYRRAWGRGLLTWLCWQDLSGCKFRDFGQPQEQFVTQISCVSRPSPFSRLWSL